MNSKNFGEHEWHKLALLVQTKNLGNIDENELWENFFCEVERNS
jgi:hypothetical protein